MWYRVWLGPVVTLHIVCIQRSSTGLHRFFSLSADIWTWCAGSLVFVERVLGAKFTDSEYGQCYWLCVANEEEIGEDDQVGSRKLTRITEKAEMLVWQEVKAALLWSRAAVMLPTEDNKLLGKWWGPFKVTKKLGPATYQIATPGESRSHRTLHINLLKEWFPQKSLQVWIWFGW